MRFIYDAFQIKNDEPFKMSNLTHSALPLLVAGTPQHFTPFTAEQF